VGTFRRAGRLRHGYSTGEVDDFFAEARRAYEALGGTPPAAPAADEAEDGAGAPAAPGTGELPAVSAGTPLALTADAVRTVVFTRRLHGYDVEAVDAALDRLHDAVARHEREVAVQRRGLTSHHEDVAAQAAEVLQRLRRPDGERFPTASRLHRGYDAAEVDALCARLRGYLEHGEALAVDDVRGALFRSRRGRRGYREASVDVLLARAVEVMVTAPD